MFFCDIVNKFNLYLITMLDDIYELAQVPSMNCHENKIWKTTQNYKLVYPEYFNTTLHNQ